MNNGEREIQADYQKVIAKDKSRFLILKAIYNESNGKSNEPISTYTICKTISISGKDLLQILEYLESEGLIKAWSSLSAIYGGSTTVSITHQGICEVEAAIKRPQDSTPHFPSQIFQITFNAPVGTVQQGGQDNTAFNQNTSINDSSRNLNISGGTVNASGAGALSLGDMIGIVANTINQLPSTSEPNKPGVKELLEQLKTAIESESSLNDEDKADALEHVQTLAEAGQKPREVTVKKPAKVAIQALKGIFSSLTDVAKLAEAGKTLIPLIAHIFGF